jgi:hypothetical protein
MSKHAGPRNPGRDHIERILTMLTRQPIAGTGKRVQA